MTKRKTRKDKRKTRKNKTKKTKKTRGGKSKFLGWEKKVENVSTYKSKEPHYTYRCKYFYMNEDDKRTYDIHLITTDDPKFKGDDNYLATKIEEETDNKKKARLQKIQVSKKKFEESIQKKIEEIVKEREEEAKRKAGEEADLTALVDEKKKDQDLQRNERLAIENKEKQEDASRQREAPIVEDAIDCTEHPEQCTDANQATDVINTSEIPIVDITTDKPSMFRKLNPFAKKPKKESIAKEVPRIPFGTTQGEFSGIDMHERDGAEEQARLRQLRLPKRQ